MSRLCERPGCSELATIAYGFDADRLLVWLATHEPDADRLRAGALCRRHADALVVPRGWTLDDQRDPAPRLFDPDPAGDDDLARALAAESPLLARAFHGTARSRRVRAER